MPGLQQTINDISAYQIPAPQTVTKTKRTRLSRLEYALIGMVIGYFFPTIIYWAQAIFDTFLWFLGIGY